MNKIDLVLIFSVITFIMSATLSPHPTVDDYNTEPYHSFDWLDDDENSFEIKYSTSFAENDFNETFKYVLYNNSVVCYPTCTPSDKVLKCTLKGAECGADPDNPAYKYYYDVKYYKYTSTYTNTSKQEDITKAINNGGLSTTSVGVTIAVCSGSFLKYSMILLSLLIL